MDAGHVAGRRRGADGGTLSRDELDVVAACYLHGIDGWRVLTTSDPVELMVLRAALDRAMEMADRRDQALARRIISTLADAMKKR
jgi:hypothetical protein